MKGKKQMLKSNSGKIRSNFNSFRRLLKAHIPTSIALNGEYIAEKH